MISRALNLADKLDPFRSTFLFGPRGSGKTQLCEIFCRAQSRSFELNLLMHDVYKRYAVHPEYFRQDIEAQLRPNDVLTVFVDEVQKVPPLLDEVHYLIEKYKTC